ncbi:MAG TPA: hypothetical protein PK268_06985 [Enterococcus sp.]|nr:hypothetical protein [Enterococcus sp.]
MITLAPNTQMNYFIPLSGQVFEADEAKEYNQTDVSIEKALLFWLTIGIGVAVGLLFIFVIVLVIKNKKLQKELKSTKK